MGTGAYEGMVVVVALLSQEEVQGHQSAVISNRIGRSLALVKMG